MKDTESTSTHFGLSFFNRTISLINERRQKIRQTKGMANFIVQQIKWKNCMNAWDIPLGILSFVLYYLRLAANLILLAQHLYCASWTSKDSYKILYAIAFEILNDLVWSTINLAQFFWLTFKVSLKAGYIGVQLEGLGMFFDEILMLFQFRNAYREHYEKLESTEYLSDKEYLKIDWHYKQINTIRSVIHLTLFTAAFIGFGLGLVTFPLSIFVYSINITSGILRVTLGGVKDTQKLKVLEAHDVTSKQLSEHKTKSLRQLIQEINHLAHFLVFVPLVLILTAPCPLTFSIGLMLLVFLSDYIINHSIEIACQEPNRSLACA